MLNHFLDLELYGCATDIRLNDGPVFDDPDGDPGCLTLPVNSWLQTGENVLTAMLSPRPPSSDFDETTQFSLELKVPDTTALTGFRSLARIAKSFDQVQVTAEQPAASPVLKLETTFSLEEEIPIWKWHSGLPITDEAGAKSALIQEYTRFHALLTAQDIAAVSDFLSEREAELAFALDMPLDEKYRKSRSDYEKFMDQAVFQLEDFETEYLKLRLFGNGRLARLDAYDGGPPIIYSGRLEPVYVRLPLIFYRPSPTVWRVIR